MSANFDKAADKYDATRGFPLGVADRIATWVLSRLPKDPTVAEIGVGTGRIAIPFIECGVRYSGFDISQQMMDRLQAKLGGDLRRAQLFMADITQPLPVPPESQDAVIAVNIFHLVDSAKAVTQVRRILKPHGALVWGYSQPDELSPQRIRTVFNDNVEALGGPRRRELFPRPVLDLLAQWGARATRHTAAVWQVTESPREILEPIRSKAHSFTWEIPDDIVAEASRRTEIWARSEYGDLDRPLEYDMRFDVDWYQF
jgi:ubiquinone/menaquinone biosynthesis C-methylase UbiE